MAVHTEGAISRSVASRCSYKAPNENGNPSFATVLKVARALGLRLHAETA